MKNEKQLQASMVMKFSQTYPERDGHLFAVRNTTFSVKDGNTQKAIGMKSGVSDLIFNDQNMICIEVKFPGSKHNKSHIINQYEWGVKQESAGGEYFIATSVSGFMSIIKGGELDPDVITLDKLKDMIENSESEVKF